MQKNLLTLTILIFIQNSLFADEPLSIGNRLELFVDHELIDSLSDAKMQLHRPLPQEVAIVHDQPWEGNTSLYHTVFQDGGIYRMYYRGSHSGPRQSHPQAAGHQHVCYAESTDGIHWTKPNLGLHEFKGSKQNNIIWTGTGAHNFAPFKDSNPNCKPSAHYKAIGSGKGGLYTFQSPDGIHWTQTSNEPVITKGAFDSQNLAYYDTVRDRYVDFHRGFNKGVRAIMTCYSNDFVNWTEPEWIEYNDPRNVHLYTNQTTAYPRAPHIFLAFPKRFVPSRNPRLHRYTGVSDVVFMSSRDGQTFNRWGEAFIRPGLQPERWVNRNNFVAWGIVETESDRSGVAAELSFYSVEGYYTGDDCRMRRYTLRPDGFVSVSAPLSGGRLVTKSLVFSLPKPGTKRTVRDEPPLPLRIDSADPIHGKGSLAFDAPAILKFDDTKNLGPQVTFAAAVRAVPSGHRRLFSTYNGSSTEPDELYFDFDSSGAISKKDNFSLRFNYNGSLVGAKFDDIGNWSNQSDAKKVHHLAATWDDGQIALYFDGRQVASGGASGAGDLKFAAGNLQFGEDYPPTPQSNEPFLGQTDDILVLRRALSPNEIAQLAKSNTTAEMFNTNDEGILLSFDNLGKPLSDHLSKDGQQTVTGPLTRQESDVELLVNFSTSAAGSIRCEIQDEHGQPIPGYTLSDSDELYGDSIAHPLSWNGSRELKSLAGKPIRLHFKLVDADLYAFRFGI